MSPLRAARTVLLAAAVASLGGACAQRAVTVETGAAPARGAEASVVLTNNLDQAVNVYVQAAGGSEIFVRQVAARTTETVAVRGVAAGSAVTLRAAPVDGQVSYRRENAVLGTGFEWRVP